MSNWAQVKSKRVTDEHRKLERVSLANKFRQTQFVPKSFEEKHNARKRDIL